MNTPSALSAERPTLAVSGPGACCAEAQADGVPCSEIRDCELCGRAHPVALPAFPAAPAAAH